MECFLKLTTWNSLIIANLDSLTIENKSYGKSNDNNWNHIVTKSCLLITQLRILPGPFIVEEKGEEIPLVE